MKSSSSRSLALATLSLSCCVNGSSGFQNAHHGSSDNHLHSVYYWKPVTATCGRRRQLLPPEITYGRTSVVHRESVGANGAPKQEFDDEAVNRHNSPPRRGSLTSLISRIRRPRGQQATTKTSKPNKAANLSQEDLLRLKRENLALREAVRQLEIENERLHQEASAMIVLETFEGEGKMRRAAAEREVAPNGTVADSGGVSRVTLTVEEMFVDDDDDSLWCDELEEGACPIEPTVSFGEALRDRAYWLVGLLILQSLSGIILARNEALLAEHPVSTCRRTCLY